MPNAPLDDLLTTQQSLDRIGYGDPSSISRWVAAGRLTPALKLPGLRGAYLFSVEEIDRFRELVAGGDAA